MKDALMELVGSLIAHFSAEAKTRRILVDRVTALAAEARATKKMVGIMDARYMTVGHPSEITDAYVAFDEPWELDSTGKLGGNDATGEKGLYKLILWSAVIHVEMFPAMKNK